MENPFANHELCDGGHCQQREHCARYMCNINLEGDYNPYVIFNVMPWPHVCPYFLAEPDEHYPQNDN